MKELYISKTRRNSRLRELRRQGHQAQAYSVRGQRLHPEHITDACEEGISYQVGLGNTDYLRVWRVLYGIRQVQTGPYAFERQVDALPDAIE